MTNNKHEGLNENLEKLAQKFNKDKGLSNAFKNEAKATNWSQLFSPSLQHTNKPINVIPVDVQISGAVNSGLNYEQLAEKFNHHDTTAKLKLTAPCGTELEMDISMINDITWHRD